MDIDNFLDKEFSQVASTPPSIEQLESKAQAEVYSSVPSSFQHLSEDLGKGNLDVAEKTYLQLWNYLSQEKLKWNKELYEHLLITNKQFSTMLNSQYNELKRKANHIYELINRAKISLKEEKREAAFKLYSEISDLDNSISSVFFEEKKVIQEQIMELYKELRNSTDKELTKRVYLMIHEINRLIDKINFCIKSNDIMNAIANYSKCMETYNQIPECFLMHKTSAGAVILEIYKSLSIYTEMSTLQKQLGYQLPPTQGYAPQNSSSKYAAPAYTNLAQPAPAHAAAAYANSAQASPYAHAKPIKIAGMEDAPKPEPKRAEPKAQMTKEAPKQNDARR